MSPRLDVAGVVHGRRGWNSKEDCMHRRVGHSLSDVVKFALVKSQALSDLQVVLVVLVLQTLGQTAASVDLK